MDVGLVKEAYDAMMEKHDNAPMESFFGRLKADIIDLVAMCGNLDAALKLVDGYLKAYNAEHYQ